MFDMYTPPVKPLTDHAVLIAINVEDPVVSLGLDADDDEVKRCCELLASCSGIRVLTSGELVAVDAMDGSTPVARITTNLASTTVTPLATVQELTVHLFSIHDDQDPLPAVTLPVTVEDVSLEAFYGEPEVVGVGPYCIARIDMHCARWRFWMFRTYEQVQAFEAENPLPQPSPDDFDWGDEAPPAIAQTLEPPIPESWRLRFTMEAAADERIQVNWGNAMMLPN